MAYDYDKLFGETRDALGPPTPFIVDFFASYDRQGATILDIGCGQGRDALFLARLGHRVTGVDLSPNGIRDLAETAMREGLDITAQQADLTEYVPAGIFDVVLCDRTLHMLARAHRSAVLSRLVDHVGAGGWLLIADEPANMADFRAIFAADRRRWAARIDRRGYLFMQRD